MILILNRYKGLTRALLVEKTGKIVKKIETKKYILTALKKISLNTKSVHGLITVSGSDTFSISRSNVAIANTLSFVWNIPMVDISRNEFKNEEELVQKGLEKIKKVRVGKFATPVYDREPNITIKQ